jgi:hypothetical protein
MTQRSSVGPTAHVLKIVLNMHKHTKHQNKRTFYNLRQHNVAAKEYYSVEWIQFQNVGCEAVAAVCRTTTIPGYDVM